MSVLAGAAISAFVTNDTMKGAVFMHHQKEGEVQIPKIYRLVDYICWIAAQERYLDLSVIGRGDKLSRLYEEDELFLSLLTRAADTAIAKRAEWTSGPVSTATIAERGYELMMEVIRDILPDDLPVLVELPVPVGLAELPAHAPPSMSI